MKKKKFISHQFCVHPDSERTSNDLAIKYIILSSPCKYFRWSPFCSPEPHQDMEKHFAALKSWNKLSEKCRCTETLRLKQRQNPCVKFLANNRIIGLVHRPTHSPQINVLLPKCTITTFPNPASHWNVPTSTFVWLFRDKHLWFVCLNYFHFLIWNISCCKNKSCTRFTLESIKVSGGLG